MSCYHALKRNYTSLTLSVYWRNTWEYATGELISDSTFNKSKTWDYVPFKPSQIENRLFTPPVGEPPMVVPCAPGKFTLYQECCNPGAYRKPYNPNTDTYSRCYKDVFALFDGVTNTVSGTQAGGGYLSGKVTFTEVGQEPIEENVNIPITLYSGLQWVPAGKNGTCEFVITLPDLGKVPYEAAGLTYPRRISSLKDFTYFIADYIQPGQPGYIEPGQPGYPAILKTYDAPSEFSFALTTALSGGPPDHPLWSCFDNAGNMGFNSTATVTGEWQDPATHRIYKPDIRVTLKLT